MIQLPIENQKEILNRLIFKYECLGQCMHHKDLYSFGMDAIGLSIVHHYGTGLRLKLWDKIKYVMKSIEQKENAIDKEKK